MKRSLKFLILAPCLMAMFCKDLENECAIEAPGAYVLNIENIKEVYPQNETIWHNSKTSSILIDRCNSYYKPALITGRDVFLDGLLFLN